MVVYICNICSKTFNKKSNYLTHISNKKKPCKEDENINCEYIIKNYKCNFCSKTFSRVDNLKRHLIERCKVRKEETQEKEAIFSNLLQRVELLEKENLQLNNKIVFLENKKETKNIQYNKNIKNLNNGIINNTFIIQHGKEDFSKIDDKVFLDAFLKNTGAKIPEKIIEGIHFNEKYPEYKNIYISDINREKVMIHNGKDWLLTPSNNITSNLLDKTIHFSENKYEAISEKKDIINERNKKKIESGLKIMELIKDFDSDEQDEFGNLLSKKEIDRRLYLREKAEEYIKLLLYNKKDLILTNKN
jgi:DNA-directed RNA polymerase subunit RPC12/RpoP